MVSYLRSTMADFPDKRTGSNCRYSIEDAALGAFSVFFTQSPSFLSFQESMLKNKGISNAQTLFDMDQIPCDNHIRDLMDEVKPSNAYPVFHYIFNEIKDSGHLDAFRSYDNNLLCALDGTHFFSSNKIHCQNCSTKEHKNGTTTYSHSAITPVFVVPGQSKVISLPPEFIAPQDGHNKQDCENAAAKRWITQYAPVYGDLGITILGDDLYCRQPLCSLILDNGLHFILVCKPDSHKTLYQWVDELEAMDAVETLVEKIWTGKSHHIYTYRFVNQVPLRDGENALEVNWCELTVTSATGRRLYKNAFVTDFEISKDNVKQIVVNGRARWKIENENNNILKTKGYHLEHNFGHGKKHLSNFLLTLNLLAFFFHTALEIFDEMYRCIREDLPTRKTFFDDIRALTRYTCFDSWELMLEFMARGLELEFPDTS
ncbi:MAG: ISNCY family transposase [Deltaproteobacteria bacterium]|nr:ISNCY family transposase [Deltaproteobacteria bacterium]